MDLAPVHTAKTTQQLLAEFWTLANWPPNMLDLNLLDISIGHILQVKVEVTPHANLNTLRLSITEERD
jgi:hypothetical protein